jgi:ribosome-associated toxin RatA of RatAB toxin-antitoxin module
MAAITGRSSAQIHAPLDQVWPVVEDVEKAPEWQGGLKALRALERDGEGRAIRCETETDVKVRTVRSTVHIFYDGPTRLRLEQEKGDLKSLHGCWELEDLGGERTRASYSLEVELGRLLGLVIRGPLIDALRDVLVGARAAELKRRIESG